MKVIVHNLKKTIKTFYYRLTNFALMTLPFLIKKTKLYCKFIITYIKDYNFNFKSLKTHFQLIIQYWII